MRDEALAVAASADDPARKLNLLREYLQAFALRSLHEQEAFRSISFVGGTALRFLEGLPRFSEDLDFSIVEENGYAPREWLEKLKRDLELSGFDCAIRWNERKTVNVGWLRFGGILKAAGLAGREEEELAIKLEVDTRPPAGATTSRTVVTRHLTFVVRHHTLPSLMAGKLHALISRPYAKGRDWYDLLWYLGRRPAVTPRIELLQHALDQTPVRGSFDAGSWREHLLERLESLDVQQLSDEVRVFLERPEDRALLTRENLLAALDRQEALQSGK